MNTTTVFLLMALCCLASGFAPSSSANRPLLLSPAFVKSGSAQGSPSSLVVVMRAAEDPASSESGGDETQEATPADPLPVVVSTPLEEMEPAPVAKKEDSGNPLSGFFDRGGIYVLAYFAFVIADSIFHFTPKENYSTAIVNGIKSLIPGGE